MRLALLAAATIALFGCASASNVSTDGGTAEVPSLENAGAEPSPVFKPEPKYSLQRAGGDRFGALARQSGHFSTPYLLAVSTDTGAIHRFQASTGTYQDELNGKLADGALLSKPQAMSAFGKELWIAESGALHQFYGFDPAFVESVKHEALKSPLSLSFAAGGESGRVLFVLDRDGDQLVLHRFETRILRATSPDQPDRIRLGELRSSIIGPATGVPALILDPDGDRVVVVNGTQVSAWNTSLDSKPNPIQEGVIRSAVVGGGLLSCGSSLDKGYWFFAERVGSTTTLRFANYETGQLRASLDLQGVDWSSGFLFDRSNMALFPRGAIFAVEGGTKINGYAWDEITRAVGLRGQCF